MSDVIIRPAPAQAEMVSGSIRSIPLINIGAEDKKSDENNKQIKDLSKVLRAIDNVCGPLTEYLKFNQCLKPEIRVILDINQTTLMLLGLKVMVKNLVDIQYMDIQNPSSQLKDSMEKTYTNLETLTNDITKSMQEMSLTMQSLILQIPHQVSQQTPSQTVYHPKESILSAMKESSRNKLPC